MWISKVEADGFFTFRFRLPVRLRNSPKKVVKLLCEMPNITRVWSGSTT